MSNRIHALAQQLTGKASIEECSLEELQHIARRHPYFSSAQFLLLQKLRQLDSPEAEAQYKKAVLFYPDPLLFDYFISSEKFYVDESDLIDDYPEKHTVGEVEDTVSHIPTEDVVFPEQFTGEVKSLEEGEETNEDEILHPTLNSDSTEQAENENTENKESTHEGEDHVAPQHSFPEEKNQEENQIIEQEVSEQSPALPHWNKDPLQDEPQPTELTFEPFHTVDYFASQGIKISLEEPKDKLGKQLKSFTAWLKTMKRLPPAQVGESLETLAEKRVETMADRSVTESHVVTEAMAEVWAKQGNREKAMETYNKLSLLNPSKRAYFAAKIDSLK